MYIDGENILKIKKKRDVRKSLWPREGECKPDLCGAEAVCVPYLNNTYTCICPHYSNEPTADLKCRRATVPLTPRSIHNIILSQNVKASTFTNQTSDLPVLSELVQNPALMIVLLLASFTSLIVFFFCWCRVRRCHSFKKKTNKDKLMTTPATLNNGLLTDERFTMNPQYSPASITEISAPIPVLMRESIAFCHEIGEGCFGKVYKGELQTDGRAEMVAVKVLKDGASFEAEEDLMREVGIMSAFRHQNILNLVGVVPREGLKNPWMVFEYMPYGDLAEVLRNKSRLFYVPPDGPTITKESLVSIAEQITNGMQYLAEQRFVHRDLAARNCLVGPPLVVKIADFGMSRDIYTCDYYKTGGSRLLPVRWMSPESVIYGRFTLESDVWSFGVVLWELYSFGKQPYFGHSNEEVLKLISQGVLLTPPDDCPSFISDIMRSCWMPEPRDRMKFSEIHRILVKAKDDFMFPASTLPRPPALPIATDHISFPLKEDILDAENYLQPQVPPPGLMREYLQPLPD